MPKGKGYNARDRAENALNKAERDDSKLRPSTKPWPKETITKGVIKAGLRWATGSKEKLEKAKEKEASVSPRATKQTTTQDISVTPGEWKTINKVGKKTYKIQ